MVVIPSLFNVGSRVQNSIARGDLGLNLRNTEKNIQKIFFENRLVQMLEILYVALPSVRILSLFKRQPQGPKWLCGSRFGNR